MSKKCNENLPRAKDDKFICNPASGLWVSKTGKVGQAILAPKGQQAKKTKSKSPMGLKKCSPNHANAKNDKYICNPSSGAWVLKTGKIGQQLLKSAKSPTQAVKSKNPRATEKKVNDVRKKQIFNHLIKAFENLSTSQGGTFVELTYEKDTGYPIIQYKFPTKVANFLKTIPKEVFEEFAHDQRVAKKEDKIENSYLSTWCNCHKYN